MTLKQTMIVFVKKNINFLSSKFKVLQTDLNLPHNVDN